MQIFGPKMQFFWPKVHFFQTLSKSFVIIMTGHVKDNIFVLTSLHGGPRCGHRGPFCRILAVCGDSYLMPKNCIFWSSPRVRTIFSKAKLIILHVYNNKLSISVGNSGKSTKNKQKQAFLTKYLDNFFEISHVF